MDVEILETVVTELVQEQKLTGKDVLNLTQKIDVLGAKVDRFTDLLFQVKVEVPPTDMNPIKNMLNGGLKEVANLIEQQPKAIVRKYQLLLLPERDSKEYYRVVFRSIAPWVTVLFLGFSLVGLGMAYVESNNAIEKKKNNYEIYTGAWWTLDHYYMGKAGRHTMQIILDSCIDAQEKK